jgi:LmbE family N-acetylglucosaminyl deacetylase
VKRSFPHGAKDENRLKRRRLPFRSNVLRTALVALCHAVIAGGAMIPSPPSADESLPSCPAFTPDDRIMVFAPHPDDESIGCGGIIQQAVAMKLPVRIVWLTYGDNNEWSFFLYRRHIVVMPEAVRRMGEVRRSEAVAAAKLLGVDSHQLEFLGYPDFGTLTIWYRHWADRPPFEGMLTKVTKVPYADAYRPGAPYKGEDILHDLEENLRRFQPTKVFVSHPSDRNVDHQAMYLFTRVALWDLESRFHPEVYPYLVHFAHWPLPRGLQPARPILPPASLGPGTLINWGIVPLSEQQIREKESALQAHRSQVESSGKYLLSFVRANELFGDFPPVAVPIVPSESQLPAGRLQRSPQLQEQLTEQEQASFVGIEQVHIWRETSNLVVTVRLSKPLAEAVSASIFAFGYRDSWPFERMPKLRINIGELRHDVLDQTRKLPADTVQIQRHDRALTVRIPLKAMGDPQRVLTCVHTYLGLGEDPLDWAEWRILEIGSIPDNAVSLGSMRNP